MKRLTAILSALVCLLILAGCGIRGAEGDGTAPPETEKTSGAALTENDGDGTAETEEFVYDRIPMVRIDGRLYLDLGRKSTVTARCGMMDGTIGSQVPGSEIPAEDDQSNFGTGYGYQFGPEEGTVELCIDGEWYVYATEEKRQELQFGKKE